MTPGPFRAVIFDLDGVLWDGEPVHHQSLNVVLAQYGHRLTDDDYGQIIGLSVPATWDWLRDHFQLSEPRRFWHAYNEAFLGALERPLQPLPGVRPLLTELRRRGVPSAVASSSLRAWVDGTLRGLALQDAFDAVVSASEVANGKPAPDLFIAAAQRLGVPANHCLAVEDTAPGIAAAKAAGMFALQLRAASTALPPLAEADLVLGSLGEFDLSLVAAPVREARP